MSHLTKDQASKTSVVPVDSSSDQKAESATGKIVPSPRSDYFFALLVTPATSYALLHSDVQKQIDCDLEGVSTAKVQFSPEWHINSIAGHSSATVLQTQDDENETVEVPQDYESRLEILSDIQSLVVKEYEVIKQTVSEWLQSDTEEILRRRQDDRTLVTIDAETVREASGLVMQNHWREALGWKGDTSAGSVQKGKLYEFVTESYTKSPAEGPKSPSGEPKMIRWNFVWDHDSGSWIRASNCQGTKKKKRESRLQYLEQQIENITQLRDRALQEFGMGYVIELAVTAPVAHRSAHSDSHDHSSGAQRAIERTEHSSPQTLATPPTSSVARQEDASEDVDRGNTTIVPGKGASSTQDIPATEQNISGQMTQTQETAKVKQSTPDKTMKRKRRERKIKTKGGKTSDNANSNDEEDTRSEDQVADSEDEDEEAVDITSTESEEYAPNQKLKKRRGNPARATAGAKGKTARVTRSQSHMKTGQDENEGAE